MTTSDNTNKRFSFDGKTVCLIGILLLAVFVIGYHCPFRAITHIPCPGCGMTRAATSLVHLDVTQSFVWHPMLIPTLILAILFVEEGWRHQSFQCRFCQILLWIWIAAMIACWIYRLIFVFPSSPLWN